MTSQLNSEQHEAVTHTEGPLLILAGAGSGKTRVLTHRMVYLLAEKGVKPWNLFAVTFTNKAAGEMKERIQKKLDFPVRDLFITTFHSACLRILRRHAGALGYGQDFTVYDDRDQLSLITEVMEELKMSVQVLNPKVAAHRINEAKHEGITVLQFPRRYNDFLSEKIALIYEGYQKKLRANQAMDFGDLILNALILFRERADILQTYQTQFTHLHVDEYQDTNRSQYELINLLASAHRNLCVVGDDDQSIYKFRGAEIRNILDFQKDYPDAKVIRLEQNYRSTQNILKAASAVVAKNKGRMGKTLWTENGDGDLLTIYHGNDENEEASFVVDNIAQLKQESSYNDVAIFYRTNAQSRPFEDALRRQRIPYIIIGGMKFYDRQEIKDMTAYMKLLVNPDDGIALKRVINVPARGIGKSTLEKLEGLAFQQQSSVWGVLGQMAQTPESHLEESRLFPDSLKSDLVWSHDDFSKSTLEKLRQFYNLIHQLRSDCNSVPFSDFLPILYEKTGYWQMLKNEKSLEAQSRMENLEEFANVVEEYILQNEEATLAGFLDQVSLSSDLDKLDPSADRVSLMTFHLAKGLEFPHVFMVGMEESLFPHSRSLENPDDMEEERRLCYVGMTRAMKKLHLSFVTCRRLFGSSQYHLPSRFLEEIPEPLVQLVGQRKPAKPEWDDFRDTSFDDEHDQRSSYQDDYSQLPQSRSDVPRTGTPQSYSRPSSAPVRRIIQPTSQIHGSRPTDGRVMNSRTPQSTRASAPRASAPRASTPRAGAQRTGSSSFNSPRTNSNKVSVGAGGVTPSSNSNHYPYKLGDRVKHPIFGMGTVKHCEGNTGDEKVTIAFDRIGMKKLLLKYADLSFA